ncbi:MAG: response regulator transcription factor [Anaerolineales bacterium]|nr:response regulator transcription factor [Anaerolineales bacterium]
MQPKKHILVVDDDYAVTQALRSLFVRSGYEISLAHSGWEALARLEHKPDLIILDLMLPGLDGYEVCRQIRSRKSYIPILMLTAKDEVSDKIKGLELGADAYLVKPFEPRELAAQVQALFRMVEMAGAKSDAGAERPLTCGPIELWPEQHRVRVAGVDVELTPKEFELLHFLLRHPGQVLGRETLLREVWGHTFEGDSRTVDVHIQRLRSKIESDPAAPQLIQTVRGFGYRLAAPDDS